MFTQPRSSVQGTRHRVDGAYNVPQPVRHKLHVLAEHCRDVGRDPAEIVKTRLGTLIVTKTREEAEARRDEFKRRRGG